MDPCLKFFFRKTENIPNLKLQNSKGSQLFRDKKNGFNSIPETWFMPIFIKKIIPQGQKIVLQILSKIYPPPGEKSGRGGRKWGFGVRCLFGQGYIPQKIFSLNPVTKSSCHKDFQITWMVPLRYVQFAFLLEKCFFGKFYIKNIYNITQLVHMKIHYFGSKVCFVS